MSVSFNTLQAQNIKDGIRFRHDYWLEKAIQIAKIEDKNIFIDTYAPWCGPCKLMDIQFQDRDLGAYFNEKYINVRIDMDGPYGKALREKYNVFFLPTLLILDKHGNPKYVSDGILSADELLSIGAYHHNAIYDPAAILASEQSFDHAQNHADLPVEFNPFEKSSVASSTPVETSQQKQNIPPTTEVNNTPKEQETPVSIEQPDENPNEKILYTANQANQNPDFLYNLTYLKLQLQDGTHWQAADKYLATQSDWSTEKNMKFIYDFVRSTKSDKFRHIIENREKYEEIFGKESVDRSIKIIVNLSLFQRYPRPEKDEALELFKLLDNDVYEVATYNYLLKRYQDEERYNDYINMALEYLEKYDENDFTIIEKIATFYPESSSEISPKEVINLTKTAIESQGGTYYKLYEVLANLYYHNKNRRKAMQAIKKAKEVAVQNNVSTDSIDLLHQRIKEM